MMEGSTGATFKINYRLLRFVSLNPEVFWFNFIFLFQIQGVKVRATTSCQVCANSGREFIIRLNSGRSWALLHN